MHLSSFPKELNIYLLLPDHSHSGKKEELHRNALLDGTRSCCRGTEGWLQPPLRYLGCGHHCHRAGGVAASHVRPAPHASSLPDVQVWLQTSHAQGQVQMEFFLPCLHQRVFDKEPQKTSFCKEDAGTPPHA